MAWLREKIRAGNVAAKEMAQGLGRLGFAAISLDWGRYTPGLLLSKAVRAMTIPAMLKVLFSWLAGGDRLQRPSRPPSGDLSLSFFTDAKDEDGRAWVGGFLEIVPGCQGPFSLEVDRSWAPWAFSKSSPNKVIAALELLATLLIVVKLWIPDSEDRQTSRVALRGRLHR